MKQIAIYGKGGIGKSTMSSNISAALSLNSKKILQIGCDPKHDSTRLLLNGNSITTVLDYLKTTSPANWNLNDILYSGFMGISCVEAGGPEPGVGCAGRGILTTFDLLHKLGLNNGNYDVILYDVLGDVVCGGFAVPMRHEYADEIYLVTSGEYMSIYAANNILRGVKNYDSNMPRIGGIIFNKRGIENEDYRIEKFSNSVGLPICESFSRSNLFSYAEKNCKTVVEYFPNSDISQKFISLSKKILNKPKLYYPNPLSDEELENVVLGTKKVFSSLKPNNSPCSKLADTLSNKSHTHKNKPIGNNSFSKSVIMREPLHGCAFNGAVNITTQIQDCITIAHGPTSCAHISYQTITSASRRTFLQKGIVTQNSLLPQLVSSNMNEGVMIFGGIEKLKDKISQVKKYSPKAIFIATTCPAGIIGEDIDIIKYNSSEKDIPIVGIKTDGNISGDYFQGVITSYIEIGKALINKDVLPEENYVNIICEKTLANNVESNFLEIKKLLDSMDIKINCRYISNTSYESIKNLLKGKFNILAYDNYLGNIVKNFLIDNYNAKFTKNPFPIGFSETKKWIKEISEKFNKKNVYENIIERFEKEYLHQIEELKPHLSNKTVMIVTYSYDLDWILETMLSLKMTICKICILNSCLEYDFKTRYSNMFNIEQNYDSSKVESDIKILKPDILLSNYNLNSSSTDIQCDTIPLAPNVGFFSGIDLAKRWININKSTLTEGWKKDELLFK